MQLRKVLPATIIVALSAGIGSFVFLTINGNAPIPPSPPPEIAVPTPVATPVAPVAEPESEEIVVTFRDREVPEMIYLPQQLELAQADLPPGLNTPEYRESRRRLIAVRAITNKARDGEFLNPRWSPDGLQVIVSRPAYEGVYVVNADGSGLRKISDANGFNARWDADGTITVVDDFGMQLRYGTDGILLESVPHRPEDQPVFAENDGIYTRGENGEKIPLTTATDRFFAPVLSPDGTHALFQGLSTGVYMVPLDGSQPPQFVGTGNNPQWLPDGSGFLFDRTRDDGHHLIAGDVLFVDRTLGEQSVLTDGNGRINQMPNVGPGNVVTFESEGEIFVGRLQ